MELSNQIQEKLFPTRSIILNKILITKVLTLVFQSIFRANRGRILILFVGILSQTLLAQTPTSPLECPSKDGIIRYAIQSNYSGSQGLTLFFYKGTQLMKGVFREGAYMDIQTDGEVRIRGTISCQNNDLSGEEWIVDIRFTYQSYKIGDVEGTPKLLRFYHISADSKLINKNNRQEIMAIRPLDSDKSSLEQGLALEYQQAATAGDVSKEFIRAISNFEYQRPDGSWRQGKIDIQLKTACKQLNPLKLESLVSDKEGTLKWRIENSNQREVRIIFEDYKGQVRSVSVPSFKKGGLSEFYTDARKGGYIKIMYETVPGIEIIKTHNKLAGNFYQEAHIMDIDSIFPEE